MFRVGAEMVAESSSPSIDSSAEDDQSDRLAPPEGKSAAEIRAEIEAERLSRWTSRGEFSTFDESAAEATRFSLGELLAAATIISVGMAGVHWLPAPVYAGIVGFTMFGWLIWLSLWSIESRPAKLIWWSLLAVYLLSLMISFLTVLKGH